MQNPEEFVQATEFLRLIIEYKSYQRNAVDGHKIDIVKFLDSGEYEYFPEITLAFRVERYNEFASNTGVDSFVGRDDAQFVK